VDIQEKLRRLAQYNSATPSIRNVANPQPQQPQQTTVKAINYGAAQNKTIFGKNAAWLLPKSLEKKRTVNAGQDVTVNNGDFLQSFDRQSPEARQSYVADLYKKAQAKDANAVRTIDLLKNNGRFKGDGWDFIEGNADKVRGGIARGALRGVDYFLPGKNTFGLERLAKDLDTPGQYTNAGKLGEKIGSVEKGIIDFGTMAKAGNMAEQASQSIPAFSKALAALKQGGPIANVAAKTLARVPGFATETGIQVGQQAGQGEKPDLKQAIGVGAAAEIGMPLLGKVFSKGKQLLSKNAVKSVEDVVNSQSAKDIAKFLKEAAPGLEQKSASSIAEYLAKETDQAAIEKIINEVSDGNFVDDLTKKAAESLPNPPENTGVPNGKTKLTENLPEAKFNPLDEIKPAAQNVDTATEQVVRQAAENGDPLPAYLRGYGDNVGSAAGKTNQQLETEATIRAQQGLSDEEITPAFQKRQEAAVKAANGDEQALQEVAQPEKTNAATPDTATTAEAQQVQTALQESPSQSGTSAPTEAQQTLPTPQSPEAVGNQVAQNADNAVKAEQTAEDIMPDASPESKKAVQDVLDALKSADYYAGKKASAISQQKASRAALADEADKAAGGGEAGYRASLKALRGKYAESGFNPISVPEQTQNQILNDIADSGLPFWKRKNTQSAIRKVWGASDEKPRPSDIKYIREYFGDQMGDSIQSAIDSGEKNWREVAGQIVGIPRSLMAGMLDLSGTLRQGGVLVTRHPVLAARNFGAQLKYFASEEAFQKGMKEITSRPTYDSMVGSKLAVDGAQGLTSTEEKFASNLAEKIPGIGKVVKATDRAYSGFLTKMRADAFDQLVKNEEAAGNKLSEEALDSVSNFINSATGRGDLGQYLEKHSTTLSATLFSPRLWKSRLDLLNPVYYAKLDPVAQKEAAKTAASFVTTVGTVLGMASLAGADVETDMRSSDFGKIKIGNTRYDVVAGLQQNMVLAWRELTGEYKSTESGEVTKFAKGVTDLIPGQSKPVDEGFNQKNRFSVLWDMIENKENPTLATATKILKGEDRGGNPINPLAEVGKMVLPISATGMYQTAKDTGSAAKGIAMNIPDIVGISSQTYGSVPTKDKGKPDATGVPEYKGKIEPNMVTDPSGKVLTNDKGKPITVKFPEGADDATKQAIIDDKRESAMRDTFKRALSDKQQAYLGKTSAELDKYVDKGTITEKFADDIRQLQVAQDIYTNGKDSKTPEGARSVEAREFYRTFNSKTKSEQEAYLKGPADQTAIAVASNVNKTRASGLSEFKPSNELSKMYAEYEKDINTHPEYTALDRLNKAKAFQNKAYKLNYSESQRDLYNEGGSADTRKLLDSGSISKEDLDAAIQMDNELYNSGITGSLKFSKKFRGEFGYTLPKKYASGGGSGGGDGRRGGGGRGGSSSSGNAHLGELLASESTGKTSPVPTFSSRNRNVSKNEGAKSIPSSVGKSASISPFPKTSAASLRKSLR